ncbi:GUN4 N-terminal ARM-like repeat domain-containing protein [Tumidithrix elongata]
MSLDPKFDMNLAPPDLKELSEKLASGKETLQLQAIPEFMRCGDAGIEQLIDFLRHRQAANIEVSYIDGKAYQTLVQADSSKAIALLQTYFPKGLLPIQSESGVDFEPLQTMLAKQDFQAADRITSEKMRELAGSAAVERGWLYFTDVNLISDTDLKILNNLWQVYSEGKFGFSVQRKIWLSLGKNWEKLWLQIGWKKDGSFTRYPDAFTWNLSAPKGHLPLSNQIRGNKTMQMIFGRKVW